MNGDPVHVVTVHEYGSVRDVVGAQDQIDQRGLAAAGLADQTDVLTRLDAEADVSEHVILAVRVAEGQVLELDCAMNFFQRLSVRRVHHIGLGIQQGADALERGSAAGGHVNHFRDCHDRPDNGCEIADELHKLTGVEDTLPDQIAAVAQNDADHAFHEHHNQHAQQNRGLGVRNVGCLVLHVELAEGQKLLGLLDEGLDDGNAGEALLTEIGQTGEGLLPNVPLLHHVSADHGGRGQQQGGGDQGEDGQQDVHAEHLRQRHAGQNQRVEEHHNAPCKALQHGVQIVGEQAHQTADLVNLIVGLAQVTGVSEHPIAKLFLHVERRAEEHDSPEKAACHDGQDYDDHGHENLFEQEAHRKRNLLAVYQNPALIQPVDDHLVEIGNDELQIVHCGKRSQTQQQPVCVTQIIPVDMPTEYHTAPLLSL